MENMSDGYVVGFEIDVVVTEISRATECEPRCEPLKLYISAKFAFELWHDKEMRIYTNVYCNCV